MPFPLGLSGSPLPRLLAAGILGPRALGRRTSGLRWLALGVALALLSPASAVSQPPPSVPLEARLAAPFRGAVSGQGLGEALRTTAQRGGVNLWLDRHVDPDQGVEGVALGPTLGEALEQLAAQGHLAVVAADSLLVVGRSAWADRAASAAMAAVPEGTAPPRDDISWPMLTTPEEALQAAVEPFGVPPAAVELPHDLWPALTWTDVEAAAVVALIGASFERWLQIDHGAGRWSDQPLPRRVAVQRSYPAAAATGPVREATQRIDPEARWKSEGARVVLSGTAAAHGPVRAARAGGPRAAGLPAARDRAMQDRGQGRGNRPAAAEERFTLRLENTPAEEALRSLAQAGQWEIDIDPQVSERLGQRVELNHQDATLRQLVEAVCRQAGVRARWEGDRLRIE